MAADGYVADDATFVSGALCSTLIRGGGKGVQGICRFYNIFALMSTIYTNNLNKIYIYI